MIVGLGNPGREYAKTRHNLGFMVLQAMAEKAQSRWNKSRKGEAFVVELKEVGQTVILVLPLTFMNRSGLAVRDIAQFHKVNMQDVLVVCDDIHLDFGQTRLKATGSAGGHNGLRSIIAECGSKDFFRLRMGVGKPPGAWDQADYVLASFRKEEINELEDFIDRAVTCCELWLADKGSEAMTEFNQRKDKKSNEKA